MTDTERYERLRQGIRSFLGGDYQNPQNHMPNHCRHGTEYWEHCVECGIDYFHRLLESVKQVDTVEVIEPDLESFAEAMFGEEQADALFGKEGNE